MSGTEGRGLPRSTGPIAASVADQCGALPPKPYLQQMCMVERGHADAHQNYGGHIWEDEPVRGRSLSRSTNADVSGDYQHMTVWVVVPQAPDINGVSGVYADMDAVREDYPGEWAQAGDGSWTLRRADARCEIDVYGIAAELWEVKRHA